MEIDAADVQDEALLSIPKKGGRTSRRSAPRVPAPNDTETEASPAMDGAERLAVSPTRPVAVPTRRQPSRNASQKKL